MKTAGQIRRENLDRLIDEFGGMGALANAAGTTDVYLSQIRNEAVDGKTGRKRQMGDRMARRLEAAGPKPKPSGWMDQDHSDAPGPLHLSAAEPPPTYVVNVQALLDEPSMRQLLLDLVDLPPATRSKLFDTIHQQAEAAREAHEHLQRRDGSNVAAARRDKGRSQGTARIHPCSEDHAQSALDLKIIEAPSEAERCARERQFYDRLPSVEEAKR